LSLKTASLVYILNSLQNKIDTHHRQINFLDELEIITTSQKLIITKVIQNDLNDKKKLLNNNKEEIKKLPKAWQKSQNSKEIIDKIYSTLIKMYKELELFMLDQCRNNVFEIKKIEHYKEHIKKKIVHQVKNYLPEETVALKDIIGLLINDYSKRPARNVKQKIDHKNQTVSEHHYKKMNYNKTNMNLLSKKHTDDDDKVNLHNIKSERNNNNKNMDLLSKKNTDDDDT
jgi:hypothetical protein